MHMKHSLRRLSLVLGLVPLSSCTTAPFETCTNTRAFSAPWSDLTDTELQLEVGRACGRVFIGFKEEGAVRGVSPTGQILTSPATRAAMIHYLTDQGVEIDGTSTLPYVTATMGWTASD